MEHRASIRQLIVADLLVTLDRARADSVREFLEARTAEPESGRPSFARALADHLGVEAERVAAIEREVDGVLASSVVLTPEALAAHDADPEVLPLIDPARYADFELMATGGMGAVYAVRDNLLGRRVALKTLREDAALARSGAGAEPTSSEASRMRDAAHLLREARITGSLAHPGIVPVFDIGRADGGEPYYTMQLVRRGGTLQDAIASSTVHERLDLIETFLQVSDAVRYAHAKGVVHQDIKPANIALGPYGETLVVDWGLAQFVPTEREVREPAAIVGTPGYMDPEMALGSAHAPAPASDVYGLGATLYHLLTGQPPIACSSLETLREALRSGEPIVAPSELDPAIPTELGAICMRALEPARRDRYSTVEALAHDVRAWRSTVAKGREVARLVREATALLDAHATASAGAPLAGVERAGALCSRVAELEPGHPAGAALARRVEQLRDSTAASRERAVRRRTLRRASVAALATLAVIGIAVSWMLDSQRRRAEEQRAAANALAEYMLTDLHEQLRAVGQLDLLDSVARQSLAHFERSNLEDLDDGERRHRSAALQQVGDVLAAAGDVQAARDAYAQASATDRVLQAADPRDEAAKRSLIRSLVHECYCAIDLGDLPAAARLHAEAEGLARLLDDGEAHREPGEVVRAMAHRCGAACRRLQGDHAGVSTLLRKALDCVAPIDGREARTRLRADVLTEYAEDLFENCESSRAIAAIDEATQIAGRYVADAPRDARWQDMLGKALFVSSRIRIELGQLTRALADAGQSKQIAASLLAADPENAKRRFRLATRSFHLGRVEHQLGDVSGAVASLRTSLADLARVTRADPANWGWRRVECATRRELADILVAAGDVAGALTLCTASLSVLDEPDAPGGAAWQTERARTQQVVALARGDAEDRAAELEALNAALATNRAALQHAPARAAHQYTRAMCLMGLGRNLMVSSVAPGEVRTSFQEADAILRRLLERAPKRIQWRAMLAEVLRCRAHLEVFDRKPAAALAIETECTRQWDRLLDVAPQDKPAYALRKGAMAHARRSLRLTEFGSGAAAREAETRARTLWREGASRGLPASARGEHADFLSQLAAARLAAGESESGLGLYVEATDLRRRLVADAADRIEPKREFAKLLKASARAHAAAGERPTAERIYAECAQLDAQLLAAKPDSDNLLEQAAYTQALRSANLRVLGRLERALQVSEEALRLHREATRRTPRRDARSAWYERAVSDVQLLLGRREAETADEHATLALHLFKRERYTEALPHFERAVEDEAIRADGDRGVLIWGAACAVQVADRSTNGNATANRTVALTWLGEAIRRLRADTRTPSEEALALSARRRTEAQELLEWLRVEWPMVASLRSDPRFEDLFTQQNAEAR